MKANEFRRGNYFKTSNMNYSKVTCIKEYSIYCSSYFPHNLELCEPIPLTEEILFKCGFKKTEILGSYNIGSFTFHSQRPCNDSAKFTLVTEIYFCGRSVLVVNGVKHLHQLQNLYFALTNQELNIEL